jgi:PAS domain S-box-containing protein
MEEASKIETGQLSTDLSLAPRFGYNLRPIIPALLYLAVYLALEWSVRACGSSLTLGSFSLTTGLNLGLLLAYGLWYAPVVAVAVATDGLWLHPLPFSVPVALLYCLVVSLVQIAAAASIRHLSSGHRVSLKKGRDVAIFMGIGTLAALKLGAAATAHWMADGPIQWDRLLNEFRINVTGFAAGIFCITPVFVIHVVPWLETKLFGIRAEKRALIRRIDPLGADRQGTLFAVSCIGLTGLALYLILAGVVSERIYVFFLLSAPLILVALRRGLEGASIAVPVLVGITLAALMRVNNTTYAIDALLAILIIASLNAYVVGAGVTQTKITERQMKHRDAILDAVGYAAQQFLGKTGWEAGVQEITKRVGEATSVTRVFLVDNNAPKLGGQIGDTCLYEWANPALSTDENDKRVLNLLRGQMIEEGASGLSVGHPYLFHTKEIPRKRREMLETLGIRSGIIIPMFVDRQWWGCLGLEQYFIDRDWPDSEIDGLKMAGQVLGTLIASVRIEQQFRQLTGNIQAVFWISSPDGHAKQYVSPGYEEIWGTSCASLQRDPESWLRAIHKEDQPRVSKAIVKQVWGEYDEEYRVERPDGSQRWVRDRAFPVRDQGGTVYRIVGIAEDITKQKKAEEQLRAATAMLSTLINHLQSGVVVEDEARRITHVNQAFNNIFNVPVPPQSLFGVDSRLLFTQSAKFAERLEQIIRAGTPVLGEELEWQGKLFLRNYIPLSMGENSHYHLWQYRDVTNERHAEEQIKSSLKEKEVLLKEIHHRVKNNLQIISSLLNLQSAEIEDPTASQKFRESQDRVKAMALIHERLYQSSDLAKIDFAGYVRSLTGHLLRSYRVDANKIRLNLEVDSVPMNLDVAIPCGLIINELVSNAFKYAFPDGETGEIRVNFGEENDHALKLIVRDSGIGFPEGGNPEDSDSLGLKLVHSLTEQLGGAIRYVNQNGFVCDISIPHARN